MLAVKADPAGSYESSAFLSRDGFLFGRYGRRWQMLHYYSAGVMAYVDNGSGCNGNNASRRAMYDLIHKRKDEAAITVRFNYLKSSWTLREELNGAQEELAASFRTSSTVNRAPYSEHTEEWLKVSLTHAITSAAKEVMDANNRTISKLSQLSELLATDSLRRNTIACVNASDYAGAIVNYSNYNATVNKNMALAPHPLKLSTGPTALRLVWPAALDSACNPIVIETTKPYKTLFDYKPELATFFEFIGIDMPKPAGLEFTEENLSKLATMHDLSALNAADFAGYLANK